MNGAGGMALGFGLAGFYLVPAAYEQRWVNIGQVLSAGLLPSQNFLYTTIDDPEHNLFNWIASTVAVVLVVVTGVAALGVYRQSVRSDAYGDQARTWRALLLLAAAATVMMLRPTAILWDLLPKLRFVQFPWRWMSILAVAFAWFLAAAAAKSRQRSAWIGATIVMLAATGVFFVRNTWWDSDDVPSLQFGMIHGQGFEGTDEYDPVGDDHYNLPAKAPQPPAVLLPARDGSVPPSGAKVDVEGWTAEERVVRVRSPQPGRLGLRLLNYPAWRIELNGAVVSPEPPTDTSQMVVAVPAGQSLVKIIFVRTVDRTIGVLLSIISALVAAAGWGFARRKLDVDRN